MSMFTTTTTTTTTTSARLQLLRQREAIDTATVNHTGMCSMCLPSCSLFLSLSFIPSSPSALCFCFNIWSTGSARICQWKWLNCRQNCPPEEQKTASGAREEGEGEDYTATADELVQLSSVANINCRHWPSRRQMLSLLFTIRHRQLTVHQTDTSTLQQY